MWRPDNYNGLVLPVHLQKLTWCTESNVILPPGLKELVMTVSAPLVMPEGLLKVTFDIDVMTTSLYNLPESVREVEWALYAEERIFRHPSTLQHLILQCTDVEPDLHTHKIHKLTIDHSEVRIKRWTLELKELAFRVDSMTHTMRVPAGCTIVGAKPLNVIME